jgi:RNA polymerase sigma-70 factor (ECF subfamily)
MTNRDPQSRDVDETSTTTDGLGFGSVLSDDAFANNLKDIIPHLRAFAWNLARSHRADDLVQETMLKAWQARARFQGGTSFKAWIFTILRNTFLSELRRQKFERGGKSMDPELHISKPAQDHHIAMLEVREALSRIHPARREALLLVGSAGMSYDEAAEICGCCVGTIKSRVHRARADLQHLLQFGLGTSLRGIPMKALQTDRTTKESRLFR